MFLEVFSVHVLGIGTMAAEAAACPQKATMETEVDSFCKFPMGGTCLAFLSFLKDPVAATSVM